MHPYEPQYHTPLHLSMVVRPEHHRVPAAHRHHLARRARPPSRMRRQLAMVLARAAARLAKEPVAALPRRV